MFGRPNLTLGTMDFTGTLTEMFPQVDRAVILNFIRDVGNETAQEFELISDMILDYIKDNIEIPNELINLNGALVMNDSFDDSTHLSIHSPRKVVIKRKLSVLPRKQTKIPIIRPVNLAVSRLTGAIPKRPPRLANPSLPPNNTTNINGTAEHHYSKMTLVRNCNVGTAFIDANENTGFLDNTSDEQENKIFQHFLNMLPQADPTYLKEKALFYQNNPYESVEEFILERIEKKDYPSIDKYLGKLDEMNTAKALTTNFNLQNFIKQFPNAPEHFAKIENPYSVDEQVAKDEKEYVLTQLLNRYRRQRSNDVEKLYKRSKYNIVKTSELLDRREQLFEDRPFTPEKVKCSNIVLLQTMAYVNHRIIIDAQINNEACRLEFARAEASASNSFLTCACCYRDDLLPEDCVTCIEGCLFCRECVRCGAEHCVAEAKTEYKCLSDCTSSFTDRTLQAVLTPITYQRLTQRRQMEEVAQADIIGLETCPFCEYATIPAEDDKIFQCENIDCKKVSCRKCRHLSHLPFRCEEIEYDEDVRMRTAIENKMTEAMLRFKCIRCQKPIIKLDGCNKITCPCGQFSCYVCKRAINGYNHFNEGGCQLWQNAEVSRLDILQQANAAKEELGINANPDKLKFDPTRNF